MHLIIKEDCLLGMRIANLLNFSKYFCLKYNRRKGLITAIIYLELFILVPNPKKPLFLAAIKFMNATT